MKECDEQLPGVRTSALREMRIKLEGGPLSDNAEFFDNQVGDT